MTRVIKKAAAAVLSVAMLASSAVALNNNAIAQDGFVLTASAVATGTIDGVNYRIDNNKAYVTSVSPTYTEIIVPRQITVAGIKYDVKGIDSGAFINNTKLISVKIEARITNLPAAIFSGCTKLQKVALPIVLNAVPQNAFYNCYKLKKVNIPFAATSIGNYAFKGCNSLEEITVHRPNMTISSNAITTAVADDLNVYGYSGTARSYFVKKGATGKVLKSGDVDGDGFVRLEDADLILEEYVTVEVAGGDSILTAAQRRWADVDGDGEVTVLDAQYVRKTVLTVGVDCPQNFEYLLLHYGI